MHGTEHRVSERRALSLLAPRKPFYPASASKLPGAPQLFSQTGPFARNGLSLARNGLRLRRFRSGVNGPGLLLRSLACQSSCPFGFSAPLPVAGSPQLPAASTLQARCIRTGLLCRLCRLPRLPFRSFRSLRIKASTGFATVRSAFRNRPIFVRSPQLFH
jgi:hypothetical protein